MAIPSTRDSNRESGLSFGGSYDSSLDRTVTASPEEIRYAQQLRLELRESYGRRAVPLPSLWWVGAD
jgi:hypothetical protein